MIQLLPVALANSLPLSTSHSRRLPSALPDASRRPSGENAAAGIAC